jgi:hypothetical protein
MSPISKLRAANDERRQAKRNSLADKLTVEAMDLGPVRYLATLIGSDSEAVLRWFVLSSPCCSTLPRCCCSW